MTIYFDNAATTPLNAASIDAMTKWITSQNFGNPSSIHHMGRQANKILRECRQSIAQHLASKENQITFTSGGSESNNNAIKGYALAHQHKGKHLITTKIEHHSVLHTMAYLEERFGFEVSYLDVCDGQINMKQFQSLLREDTILVSMMFANNETGDLLPIKEVGDLLKHHQAAFHVDAVQVVGKIALHPDDYGIDLMSASAHKFHGPKGVGFLYNRGLKFDSLIQGGEQEEKRRAGTENMIGIVGMTAALDDAFSHLSQNFSHVEQLEQLLQEELTSLDFHINGRSKAYLPHVLNLSFPNHQNSIVLTQLDLEDIAVSTGSACTAGTVEPSHVLSAYYGKDSSRLKDSIRISFSDQNTQEEVFYLAKILTKILGD
ncbi:cysteine desulfurase family protein [Streptococcus ictaluri]|uniref:cysteine desulfurase n=1 Tax=Streptococcus ictaluri 707-05 TaxID=764299 RepID=G5K3F4_9STRE|nr:cysteine desulfurase family protein [Streptococcus ictaluri]EHI69721.1 aminotransferase, class V [Streptococcus ictaluri 707-05]